MTNGADGLFLVFYSKLTLPTDVHHSPHSKQWGVQCFAQGHLSRRPGHPPVPKQSPSRCSDYHSTMLWLNINICKLHLLDSQHLSSSLSKSFFPDSVCVHNNVMQKSILFFLSPSVFYFIFLKPSPPVSCLRKTTFPFEQNMSTLDLKSYFNYFVCQK